MGVGLFVGVWIARYLGPDLYGQLSYVMAFVGYFGVIAGLGLNVIVVRDIVRNVLVADSILGTAFVLQTLGGVVAVVLAIGAMAVLQPDDLLTRYLVAVLSLTLVFKSSDVIKLWFESRVQSRYVVLIENGVFIALSVVKVVLILQHASLIMFAWVSLVESACIATGLFLVYGYQGGVISRWQASLGQARYLIKEGWPLLLSALSIFMFMRMDQIMIGTLGTVQDVGFYAAALRFSELWFVFPGMVASSVFPLIAHFRAADSGRYYGNIGIVLRAVIGFHIVVSFVIALTAGYLVDVLLGAEYQESAAMLSIHVWTGVFQAMGIISGQWMVYEGLLKAALVRNLCGALVSLAMNAVLIPMYGGIGAAISALVSAMVAYYFFDLFSPETRIMFRIKTRAMCLGGGA